jgi:signal transduction histidine kinase
VSRSIRFERAVRAEDRGAALLRVVAKLHTRWLDTMIVVVLGGVGLLGLFLASQPGYPLLGQRRPETLAYALVLLQAAPLGLRRRSPLPVLGTTLLATFAARALNYPLTGADFAPAVAFYTVASRRPPAQALRGGFGVAAVVLTLTALGRVNLQMFVLAHVVFAAAWVLGDALRRRGERIAALEVSALAERRAHEQQVRQAVVDERMRIAQELHDLAAHALGVIAIQAQAATRTLSSRPEQARNSLSVIEGLTDEALADLRQLLGFLRNDEVGARRPQPTLDDLERLADGFRESGLPVQVVIEGKRRRLSAALQTSAYRVVQESLTNALKHAGHATAVVAVRYGSSSLEVEVTDTGKGPDAQMRPGQGLTGMRERMSVFGGSLDYGAGSHGGFVVCARFPVTQADAA